jgi:hypothetical protein
MMTPELIQFTNLVITNKGCLLQLRKIDKKLWKRTGSQVLLLSQWTNVTLNFPALSSGNQMKVQCHLCDQTILLTYAKNASLPPHHHIGIVHIGGEGCE